MAPISLHDFVESITRFVADGIAEEQMTRLLTTTHLSDEELAPFVHFNNERYTRSLIHRNDNVEILALCWPKGSQTKIHDHAGQHCWMVAHSGSFVVDDYRQISGSRATGSAKLEHLTTIADITLGMPDFRFGSERDIHRVAVAPNLERAVSVHIYAKPYASCFTFDEASQRIEETALKYDFTKP